MTKIDIISGFLGAGKTTLIKKLLAEAYQGEKLVLIENEFGEISIDGGFLKDSGVQVSEMSSGCICCSLVGDFNKALKEVHQQFQPDRILIEPSGVGKLSDVIVAVENTVKDVPDMKLNSFVTVADASKVKVYMKNFGEFYNNQIEAAGTIILSRTQKLSQEKLEASPLPGIRSTARPFWPLWRRSLWLTRCWRRCVPSMRPTSMNIITIMTMITSIATMTTMTMTTTTAITIMTGTTSIIMTTIMTSMSTTIITTARSAMIPTAAAITIITTPTRCSPPGARRR